MDPQSKSGLQVVLLEDDASDAELIQVELQRSGMAVTWQHVTTESGFRDAIALAAPDLVLADYTLPGFDGLAALRILRDRWPDVPFVFVSGSLGEERAIEAVKSGATDYVLKDRMQRLPAVVQRALTEARERHERRKAELALEEQRVLLTALINNLPDLIYAIDSEGRLTVVNRSMLEDVKLPRHAVLGHKFSELGDSDFAHESEAQDASVLRSGRPLVNQEHAWVQRDGSVKWFITSRTPLRDAASGKVIGLVCAARDITSRKELEQEILEISNREQRRLGSDLHDGLGQELTGLSLMMKGLEVQLSREAPTYLPQVAKMSELVARTIQSARSLARGLAPVNLERGGLPEALRHLVTRCSDLYGLDCTFDDKGYRLMELDEGSATHLYRIAQEATTNAARHAHAQHIAIELRTTARRLHLSITDDGMGLSAGLARGKPGLGLKIMEYRARMMGGNVAFEEPGQGTRIALSCPLSLLRPGRASMQRTA